MTTAVVATASHFSNATTASHFSCATCEGMLCFASQIICFPPTPLALHGGALFAQSTMHGTIEFQSADTFSQELITCKQCRTSLGFKIINVEGLPPYIKVNMLHFSIDKVTSNYGNYPLLEVWFANSFLCKHCCTVIAFETDLQILETLQHYSVSRVVLNSLCNTYVDENASKEEGTADFLRVVCCRNCTTHLGWRRVKTNDGTAINNGVAHLVLNGLWFRYCNLVWPAEYFISPVV